LVGVPTESVWKLKKELQYPPQNLWRLTGVLKPQGNKVRLVREGGKRAKNREQGKETGVAIEMEGKRGVDSLHWRN